MPVNVLGVDVRRAPAKSIDNALHDPQAADLRLMRVATPGNMVPGKTFRTPLRVTRDHAKHLHIIMFRMGTAPLAI